MKRFFPLALIAAATQLALLGCKHNDPRPNPQPCPQSYPQPMPYPGPGPAPGPGPVMGAPPKGAQWSPDLPPPAPVPSQSKSIDPYEAKKPMEWQPGLAPSVRLYPPEVVDETDAPKQAQFIPQEGTNSAKPFAPKVEDSVKPMAPATTALPVGIPKFVLVRDHLANGLRPSLDDGLDWLAGQGYTTVLCLQAPGAPDGADRKQVEKRGLKFVSLEVSPMTLAQKHIDDFNRLVGDSAVLPLFVYDSDGSLAGSMWYLHFRTAQLATDDAARQQARPLGLREDAAGAHQQMWQASQKLLADAIR